MKTPVSIVAALLGLAIATLAAQESSVTALGALKLLPKGAASRLARIEAREGTPNPERWHILVHDPETENGLREYVVAAGEVVASRTVSQFADELKPEDVIGDQDVKIDSDRAIKITQQYAEANRKRVAVMNLELRRDGEGAVPLWSVTCADATGTMIGEVVLSATKGNVIAHGGFPVPPGEKKAPAEKKTERKASSERRVVRAEPVERRSGSAARQAPPPQEPVAEPPPLRRDERGGFFDRAGGKLRRFFSGRDDE